MNSASRIGNPMKIVKNKKIRKKAPPPDIPVIYGNFQIAPRPIAEPAADKMKPSFDVHCSLFCSIRSEEHTSELQSRGHLVCRLLLEKKNLRASAEVPELRMECSTVL